MDYIANRRYRYQWDPRFMTQGIQIIGWRLRTATRNDGKLARTDHDYTSNFHVKRSLVLLVWWLCRRCQPRVSRIKLFKKKLTRYLQDLTTNTQRGRRGNNRYSRLLHGLTSKRKALQMQKNCRPHGWSEDWKRDRNDFRRTRNYEACPENKVTDTYL